MLADTIAHDIRFGNLTHTDLMTIAEAIKYRRSVLAHEVKRELHIGAQVSFVSGRNGRKYSGTVTSIKIKNAIVNCGSTNFRVPCNMLMVE